MPEMPKEKMTVKDIMEEFGIGDVKVYEMFKDPELPVQTYTKPQFVLRSELLKYFSKRHDNLSSKIQ